MPVAKQRRRRPAKKAEKKMEEVAQKVYNKNVENKQAIFDLIDRKPFAPILTGDVANAVIAAQRPNGVNSNYYQLLPGINQSISGEAARKYNSRVGNEILLRSVRVKGFLEYDLSFATDTLPANKKLLVRVMILSAKRAGNYSTAFTNISDRMLTNGFNAGENTGPFTGAAINGIQEINRDVFTVHYEKKFYMTAPVLLPGTTTPDVGVNPSSLKFIDKTINFGGKTGKKLNFANASATIPEDFSPFIVIGYSSCSHNAVPSNGLVSFTYNSIATYTDA